MKKLVGAVVIALSLLANQAQAEGCYSAKELEAEQGLRIHSELMVIGLTCIKMPGGESLYRKYAEFTRKNSGLIGGYEKDLINYYRAQGAGDPEIRLHTLRTNLANSISGHTVSMGTATFCNQFSPRIDKALSMDQRSLRHWAQHVWADTPVSEPVCRKL